MSDSSESGAVFEHTPSIHTLCSGNSNNFYNNNNNYHKRVLKSKENIFKSKCSKELKKKLKKYKLRRDGQEDPDILNVSQILITSLRIKSPTSQDICSKTSQYIKPSNYLTKMVRRKKNVSPTESLTLSNGNNLNIQQNEEVLNIITNETKDKKNLDAFQLMMNSRHKSIGTNSPGKEKESSESESREYIEKKDIKVKRILMLEKMAQAKGSIKKKEIEEYRDRCIERKMIKRAERLKDMITKADCDADEKDSQKTQLNVPMKKCNVKDVEKLCTNTDNVVDLVTEDVPLKQRTLKLCDIFKESDTTISKESKSTKKIPEEDIEFLKKLSPSIKKKENMLCYFKKLTKDLESDNENIEASGNSVIKVKFTPKRKKKIRKVELCKEDLAINQINEDEVVVKDIDESLLSSNERRKRKRNNKLENIITSTEENINIEESGKPSERPKRNTKKPVKYTNDIEVFSSDEELHIFTPKKKKNNVKISEAKTIETAKIKQDITANPKHLKNGLDKIEQSKVSKNINSTKNKQDANSKKKVEQTQKKVIKTDKLIHEKKPVKLAPIFVTKTQLSAEAIEAKQNFLKSGVPEKLKKTVVQAQNNIMQHLDAFHTVVHVTQHSHLINDYQGRDWFDDSYKDCEVIVNDVVRDCLMKQFLTSVSTENIIIPAVNVKQKPEKVLKCIKKQYPKFPVYRTYHLLRGKSKGDFKDCNYPDLDNSIEIIDGCEDITKESPEKLNWCDKFKPVSSKQIIGNFYSIKEIKKWLESWTETLKKVKGNPDDSSDLSDFYNSETDSRDALRNMNNLLILTGPTGSGKTSTVYAVAAELSIKVIEVNASSKRTGKIMLQDLQEATQSHKVDRGKSGAENSQKSQEVQPSVIIKKRGRPKKNKETVASQKLVQAPPFSQSSLSQETVRTGMSLILIDDADIVFDQDDGFCSAISQLIHCSKRPVILATSSPSCPHLQKFLQSGKIIHMKPLVPRMIGTWLDIMCLAEVGVCYPGLGAKVLDLYSGDVRKTINCLQFYMNSNKQVHIVEEVLFSQIRFNIDDENSSMSWTDSERLEENLIDDNELKFLSDSQFKVLHSNKSIDTFNIWWNIPSLFYDHSIKKNDKILPTNNHGTRDIEKLANVLDILSLTDSLNYSSDNKKHLTSKPWHSFENDSVVETENFDNYDICKHISKEMEEELVKATISEANKSFKCNNRLNDASPMMSSQRQRDRVVCRHNTLSSFLNPSAVLDRRAAALDYWPSCRTMCRLEKCKTDTNTKRNNRYCHYLKSLNVLCKSDFFDALADSLS